MQTKMKKKKKFTRENETAEAFQDISVSSGKSRWKANKLHDNVEIITMRML
jgi:hypothetical protein